MIGSLSERHIERMRELLDHFERRELSLHRLISGIEALLGLLLDETDPEWVDELQAECNRLESVNAAAITEQRELSEWDVAEIADAISDMRLILAKY